MRLGNLYASCCNCRAQALHQRLQSEVCARRRDRSGAVHNVQSTVDGCELKQAYSAVYLLRRTESVQGEAVAPDDDADDFVDAVEQEDDPVPATVGVERTPGVLHCRLLHLVRHSTSKQLKKK
jgi:hypothetical protein